MPRRHRIIVTQRAEDDLEAIGTYVARESPRAAFDLLFNIRDRIAGLAHFPERYRLRAQLGPGYRVCVVDSYVVATAWRSRPSLSCGSFEGHGTTSVRSEEHTSELQSLLRISYAVFC